MYNNRVAGHSIYILASGPTIDFTESCLASGLFFHLTIIDESLDLTLTCEFGKSGVDFVINMPDLTSSSLADAKALVREMPASDLTVDICFLVMVGGGWWEGCCLRRVGVGRASVSGSEMREDCLDKPTKS